MALIKCPECKKEISDTNKKCPQCGFKLKDNKFLELIKKNRKLLIIIGIVLILIAVIFVIITNLPSGRKDAKTMIKYLEKHNFECVKGIEGSEQDGTTCTNSHGDRKEIFEIDDTGSNYIVQDGSYKYSIMSARYYENSKPSQLSIIMTDGDELTCKYSPEGGSFKYGGEFELSNYNTDEICIRYLDKINNSVRDFENYYKRAGLELGK